MAVLGSISRTHLLHTRRLIQCCQSRRAFLGLSSWPSTATRAWLSSVGDLKTYRERKILPYSQRQLYALVADIEAYSSFVPFCTSSRVLDCRPPPGLRKFTRSWLDPEVGNNGAEYTLDAELSVGFMGFDESYTSTVSCRKWDRVRASASHSSVFKTLSTTWFLSPSPSSSAHPSRHDGGEALVSPGCGVGRGSAPAPTFVSLILAYEFASPLHRAAAGAVFEKVSAMIMAAFEKRCRVVYGPGT